MNLNIKKISFVMFCVSLGAAIIGHSAYLLGKPTGDLALPWIMTVFWLIVLKFGWPKNPFD